MTFGALICGVCRYFSCTPQHGLFAPVSKVTLAVPSVAVTTTATKQSVPVKRPARTSSMAQPHGRTGSQESLSSMSSVTSSASRSRVRLGVSAVSRQVDVC